MMINFIVADIIQDAASIVFNQYNKDVKYKEIKICTIHLHLMTRNYYFIMIAYNNFKMLQGIFQ